MTIRRMMVMITRKVTMMTLMTLMTIRTRMTLMTLMTLMMMMMMTLRWPRERFQRKNTMERIGRQQSRPKLMKQESLDPSLLSKVS